MNVNAVRARGLPALIILALALVQMLTGCGTGGSALPSRGAASPVSQIASSTSATTAIASPAKQAMVPPAWSVVPPGSILAACNDHIVRVIPTTGEQRLIASGLDRLTAVAWGTDGFIYGTLLGTPGKVVRVDPTSGETTVVADKRLFLTDLAAEPDGRLVIAEASLGTDGGLLRLEIASGTLATLTGPVGLLPVAVAVAPTDGEIRFVDDLRRVGAVDPISGTVTPIPITGLNEPVDLDLLGETLYFADAGEGRVMSAPRDGGAASTVTPDIRIPGLQGITVSPQGTIFIRDGQGIERITAGSVFPVSTNGLLSGLGKIALTPPLLLSAQSLTINQSTSSFSVSAAFAVDSPFDPATTGLTIGLGAASSWHVPAGAFRKTGVNRWLFTGSMNEREHINAQIVRLESQRYRLRFDVIKTTLGLLSDPVTVSLTLDGVPTSGTSTIGARIIGK